MEFVLTHPNGWEAEQQQCCRRAVERAGFIPTTPAGRSRVHLIPEGEASLRYCVSSLREHSGNTEPQGVVIIDAGGGIIDLSMYSMSFNPLFCEEIAPPECMRLLLTAEFLLIPPSCLGRLQGSVFVTRRAVALLQGPFFFPFVSPSKGQAREILTIGKLQGSPHSNPEDMADLAREFDEQTKLTISSVDKVTRIKIGNNGYNNPQYNIKRGLLELSG